VYRLNQIQRLKERKWVSSKVAAKVDTAADVRGNFIKRSVQNAKRNAKSLSNQAVIVQSTAKTVIPKERLTAAKHWFRLCSDL
jgi:hypothetical protein